MATRYTQAGPKQAGKAGQAPTCSMPPQQAGAGHVAGSRVHLRYTAQCLGRVTPSPPAGPHTCRHHHPPQCTTNLRVIDNKKQTQMQRQPGRLVAKEPHPAQRSHRAAPHSPSLEVQQDATSVPQQYGQSKGGNASPARHTGRRQRRQPSGRHQGCREKGSKAQAARPTGQQASHPAH